MILFRKLSFVAFAALAILCCAGQKLCGEQCDFRLCKANVDIDLAPIGRRLLLRDPRVAIPPFVCRKDIELVRVRSVGQARVAPNRKGVKRFLPISKFNPAGLSKPFSKRYFGVFDINFPKLPGKVGIGRLANVGNQDEFADDLCVILPITRYEVMQRGTVVPVQGRATDCVSFRTWTPLLLVELTWDSADDFDLIVTEPPGGETISRINFNSKTGGRLITDNIGTCDADELTGKEQVRWLRDDNPLPGKYTVKLIHFTNCGQIPTKWNIAVIAEGKVLVNKQDISNTGDESLVTTFTFTL